MAVRREKRDQREQAAQEQGDPPLDVEEQDPTHAERQLLNSWYARTARRRQGRDERGAPAATGATKRAATRVMLAPQPERPERRREAEPTPRLNSEQPTQNRESVESRRQSIWLTCPARDATSSPHNTSSSRRCSSHACTRSAAWMTLRDSTASFLIESEADQVDRSQRLAAQRTISQGVMRGITWRPWRR